MTRKITFAIVALASIFCGLGAIAQISTVSNISENFDVACVGSPFFASGWFYYNPIPSTDPPGAWHCTATDGNHATPGMLCTGYYGGKDHLDTSYLITPKIDISKVSGDVYFRFDSKATLAGPNEAKLNVLHTEADPPYTNSTVFDTSFVTTHIAPVFSDPDESDWTTNEVKVSPLKVSAPFHLVFMYTSTVSSAKEWYLDNVNLTTVSVLDVRNGIKHQLPLTIVGTSSPNHIQLACDVATAGSHRLIIYDMEGRVVYTENLYLHAGTNNYTISGTDLRSGLYCIKLNNEKNYGTAKVLIQ